MTFGRTEKLEEKLRRGPGEDMFEIADFSDLGLPIRLPRPIRINAAKAVAEGIVRPTITSQELSVQLTALTGAASEEFRLSTRIFEFDVQEHDQVLVRAAENNLPLIVCRDDKVIVNFDIGATQAFQFDDSPRPIYTYIPGFNIQKIPEALRRPLSNFVQSLASPRHVDVIGKYRRLPLTSFEFVILLLHQVLGSSPGNPTGAFQWPAGKRAVFISLHDVDTRGFFQRRERDPLFQLEQKHQIQATWFMPTGFLQGKEKAMDFLWQAGHEVGWHGHNHDHRLPFRPFADQRIQILRNSWLCAPENFPTGMRTPKLLKSNYLFDLLECSCPALRYDTSFLRGIVPYYLWVDGRPSNILEIPTTIPTDILLYNQLYGLPRARRSATVLEAQIARTKKLLKVGGLISIVTHPEKGLTERPDFLDIYDQYLSFIKSCPDIWFTTAGEVFRYWTSARGHATGLARDTAQSNGGWSR
jgi:peptidoglycan/xylan/chitin deacetylase (PgdA/CDA1 family)